MSALEPDDIWLPVPDARTPGLMIRVDVEPEPSLITYSILGPQDWEYITSYHRYDDHRALCAMIWEHYRDPAKLAGISSVV